jgi:hypothetical protein
VFSPPIRQRSRANVTLASPVVGKEAHLDTAAGTPDLSGSNTRRLHTCRMNPAFRANTTSCIGGGVRLRPWKRELR